MIVRTLLLIALTVFPAAGRAEPPNKLLYPLPGVMPPELPQSNPITFFQTRVILGTLPPDGISAISFSVANGHPTSSLQNVSVSIWIVTGRSLAKLGDFDIGYVAVGEGRSIGPVKAPIPHGRIVLCASAKAQEKAYAWMQFYESDGEYARFGPMRLMRQFRDPVVNTTEENVCRSMPAAVAPFLG
jgi:hypothetical protein